MSLDETEKKLMVDWDKIYDTHSTGSRCSFWRRRTASPCCWCRRSGRDSSPPHRRWSKHVRRTRSAAPARDRWIVAIGCHSSHSKPSAWRYSGNSDLFWRPLFAHYPDPPPTAGSHRRWWPTGGSNFVRPPFASTALYDSPFAGRRMRRPAAGAHSQRDLYRAAVQICAATSIRHWNRLPSPPNRIHPESWCARSRR